MTMLPMSLVVSPMPTVFLSATTPMLLPVLLKPYRKPALSCCSSQETLQFLPPSLLQPLPLTTAATATTPITQLQKRTIVRLVPSDTAPILSFPTPTANSIF